MTTNSTTRRSSAAISRDAPWWRDLLILSVLFGLLFAEQLGVSTLVNPDEGRYAEVPREMVASGDWVTPRLDGVIYFEKPPLMYWCVALFLKVFGSSEWSMRATPACFAFAGVLITYAAVRRLHSRTAAFAAAAVLGTMMLYYALGRILILDMAVSVLMSATLLCFILGINAPPGRARRWLFYGLYVSAALATLTKGLIGFLLTGLVMFVWLLVFNQWKRLRPLYLPTGLLLFLAVAVPWHILAAQRNPDWARFYFVREHWERFTTTEHGRVAPWWFFIPVIVLGIFPWSGFLWPAVRDALRGGWARRKENANAWFYVTWIVLVWLFFSKSQSKLIPYILPVFPAIAVLIGLWLARLVEGADRRGLKTAFWSFSVGAVLLAIAMLIAVFRPGIVRDASQMEALQDNAICGSLALVAGAIAVPWLMRRGRLQHAFLALVGSASILFLTLAHAQDEIARPGTHELAAIVNERARPDDRVAHYHDFFHDFTFYGERLVDVIGYYGELEVPEDRSPQIKDRFIDDDTFRQRWAEPRRMWVVARKREVDGKLFADPTFHYHLIAETRGHYLFSNQP
jgi:4-amino-4-deoxy-L-arabinose transferase-like glycosyltransferase